MAEGKELALTVGPFLGVNDTPSYGAQDAQRARFLSNMYGPASAVGGDLISRPGYNQVSFAPYAGSGTISVPSGSGGVTVTGTLTAFTTQLSVGDLLTYAGGTAIVTAIATDTSATVTSTLASAGSVAYTITPAAIVGGQILGGWQHTLTTGVSHRLFLVTTTSPLVSGGTTGQYPLPEGGKRPRRTRGVEPRERGLSNSGGSDVYEHERCRPRRGEPDLRRHGSRIRSSSRTAPAPPARDQ